MLVESAILHLVEEKVPFSFVLLEKQCNQWFHLEVKNNENWKFIIESEIICRQLWLDHFTSFNTDFALCSSQSICWQQTNQLKFRFISLEINMSDKLRAVSLGLLRLCEIYQQFFNVTKWSFYFELSSISFISISRSLSSIRYSI